jgi:pyruvate/2-oxoglutarate/acetoin dehydrogenase E1 component
MGSAPGCSKRSSCLKLVCRRSRFEVAAPQTPNDARHVVDGNATTARLIYRDKLLYRTKGVVEEQFEVPLVKHALPEKGRMLQLSYSIVVQRTLDEPFNEKEGIEIEVIDLRSLRPLDEQAIHESVTKTGRLLIVHEAPMIGGFGGELAAVVASGPSFDRLDAPIVRLGGKECPIPYNRILERAAVPQTEDIVEAARKLAQEGR